MNRREFMRRTLYVALSLGLPAGVVVADNAAASDVLTLDDLKRAKAMLEAQDKWCGSLYEQFFDPKTRERLPDHAMTDYYETHKTVRHYHGETLISEEVVEYPE